jgi:hypothetical protein
MEVWCNILHYNIGIKKEDSDYIISTKNRWKNIYQNNYYNIIINKNVALHNFVYSLFKENETIPNKKIKSWFEFINNPFYNSSSKEEIWTIFNKTQKMYFILIKFMNMCKVKKMKVKVDEDLNMNKITIHPHLSIVIVQNCTKYYFTLYDLINICNSSLCYSSHFFAESYSPKNPYTNEPFHVGILLKIYNAIRYSNYKMPFIYELFYRSCFNIKHFKIKNDYLIREEILKKFIKNASKDELYDSIREMLAIKCFRRTIKVVDDFPKDILVKALKPYIFFYLISNYSLRSSEKQWEYYMIMKKSILHFFKINSQFGRKKIKIKKMEKDGITHSYKEEIFETDFKETKLITPSFNEILTDLYNDNNEDEDEEDDDEEEEL